MDTDIDMNGLWAVFPGVGGGGGASGTVYIHR